MYWFGPRLGSNIDTIFSPKPEPPSVLGLDEIESPEFRVYDASAASSWTLPLKDNGIDRLYHVAEVAAGDRVRFKDLKAAVAKYNDAPAQYRGLPQGKLEIVPRTETLGYDMNVFNVIATETQVTVQWQDLTVTETSSRELIPDPTIADSDEVWPGEVICTNEERKDKGEKASWGFEPAKVGVVQSVQSRDRIATVRWYENPEICILGQDLIPPSRTGKLQDGTEDISLYDIRPIPSLTHHRADFVMLHPDAVREAENGCSPPGSAGPDWFGEIVDLGLDGKITVRLGVATPIRDVRLCPEKVTFVYNNDLHDEYLNNASMPMDGDSEFSDDEMTDDWDSESMNEMWIEYEEGMRVDPPGSADEDEWSTEDEDANEAEENITENEASDAQLPGVDIEMRETPENGPRPQSSSEELSNGNAMEEDTATTSASVPGNSVEFDTEILAPFLVLDTPPPTNHHYYYQDQGSTSSFLKRIGKEHKILRSSLPPGIFVRTWESRLNLLRVMMIGPADTPYEYAPFVIDLYIGWNYPSAPPEAFFHSWTGGNGPINPNLYEDGKICLSLLGTWHADERNESWSSKSTLLQVLVSIHGLVLNKEPYYNEAGYDVHREAPETKLSSALYSERAYFRARAFITHALTNTIEPFTEELKYLYLSDKPGAPQLLAKAITSAKEVVEQSSKDDGEERDGLRRISRGALVMLKRQVEKLEELRK
jgi:ubiquitin-conjugating enzyme E2 O